MFSHVLISRPGCLDRPEFVTLSSCYQPADVQRNSLRGREPGTRKRQHQSIERTAEGLQRQQMMKADRGEVVLTVSDAGQLQSG